VRAEIFFSKTGNGRDFLINDQVVAEIMFSTGSGTEFSFNMAAIVWLRWR